MSAQGDKLKELYDAGPPWPYVKVCRQSWNDLTKEFPGPSPEWLRDRKTMGIDWMPPIGMQIFTGDEIPEDEIHIVSYDSEQREFTTRQIIKLGGEVNHVPETLAPD
jgi:hypothetical protein